MPVMSRLTSPAERSAPLPADIPLASCPTLISSSAAAATPNRAAPAVSSRVAGTRAVDRPRRRVKWTQTRYANRMSSPSTPAATRYCTTSPKWCAVAACSHVAWPGASCAYCAHRAGVFDILVANLSVGCTVGVNVIMRRAPNVRLIIHRKEPHGVLFLDQHVLDPGDDRADIGWNVGAGRVGNCARLIAAGLFGITTLTIGRRK